MKMVPTEVTETSTLSIHTSGNHPKEENTRYSQHGESLKTKLQGTLRDFLSFNTSSVSNDSDTIFLWNVVAGLKIALCHVPEDQNVNLYVYRNLKLSKPGVHKWRPLGRTGHCILYSGDWISYSGDWILYSDDWILYSGDWILYYGDWILYGGDWILYSGDWILYSGA
jgi:hypothetical protein